MDRHGFCFCFKRMFFIHLGGGGLRGTMNDGLKCTVNGSGIMEEG